jgi:hypothetical protein
MVPGGCHVAFCSHDAFGTTAAIAETLQGLGKSWQSMELMELCVFQT